MDGNFGIYVHIPFCVHKCSYCDFYSFTKYSHSDFSHFAKKLEDELHAAAQWLAQKKESRSVTSIFLGGGTPSLFPVPMLSRILQEIWGKFSIASDVEVTIEANPETVNHEFCAQLRALTPVNRVSLGAQSFQRENLQRLERLGSAESIVLAAELLQEYGFSNINLDFIFAIPGQSKDALVSDLVRAASLKPKHLSAYNLTLKPGHLLFRSLPSDDAVATLYEVAVQTLHELGYDQYEISNYAVPGYECRHNLLYWEGHDYLGIGPSASSRFFEGGTFRHRKQVSDFSKYMQKENDFASEFETSTTQQTLLEAVFLEIRCNRGVHLKTFFERFNWNFRDSKHFEMLCEEKLIEVSGEFLRLTDKGRLLADSVSLKLLD